MRFVILIIGIISLLFIGVNVLSKFMGQHYFISGSNVNCSKCHWKQAYFLSISKIHSNFACQNCHSVSYSNDSAHAATTIPCTECHVGVMDKINNSMEAHRDFVLFAERFGLKKGPNEACIACHTSMPVKITFVYYEYINYTIYINGTPIYVNREAGIYKLYYYDIISVMLGPKRNFTVYKTYGYKNGSSHYWVSLNEINCTECHKNIILGVIDKWSPGSTPAQGFQHTDDVNDKRMGSIDYGDGSDALGLTFEPHTYVDKNGYPRFPDNETFCKYCHYNNQWDPYPVYDSSAVHAAVKLSCLTCHNESGPYPPSKETPDEGGHYSEYLYKQVWEKIPRNLHGDFCSGCHHWYNHRTGQGMGQGCICHGDKSGYINNIVYTEPKAYESDRWIYRTLRPP